MTDNSERSDGSRDDSGKQDGPLQGMKGWLADLFSGEPEDIPELLQILQDAADRRVIDDEALNIVHGALHVGDMHARDIMIPRSSLVVIQEDQEPAEMLPIIIESRHSRFPVVGEDVDDVKGILHAKDLLPLVLEADHSRFSMKDCIRPAAIIPESKTAQRAAAGVPSG